MVGIKKLSIALLASAAICLPSLAAQKVVKVTGNGKAVEFLLADEPTVCYAAGGLQITAGATQVVYPADAEYIFEIAEAGAVNSIDQASIRIGITGSTLSVDGNDSNGAVTVSDLSGRIIAQSKGNCSISLPASGMAIVTVANKSFKILIK